MGDDYITRSISGIFTGASSKQALRYQWRTKLYGKISQYHFKKSYSRYKVGSKLWSYYGVNNTLNRDLTMVCDNDHITKLIAGICTGVS
jgi:hypothetical protein